MHLMLLYVGNKLKIPLLNPDTVITGCNITG